MMSFDITPTWQRLQGMINGFLSLVPNLILAVILFAFFIVIAKWMRSLIQRFFQDQGHQTSVGILIGRVSSALIYLVGLLVSLSVILPSFKAADLIQVLGLGSVAIGFAFREVLQNFLAGVLILLAQPFRIGQEIIVEGYEGTVEEIQARATLIRTNEGSLVVIPNSTIYTQKITILDAYERRRTTLDLVLARGTDISQAQSLLREVVTGIKGVLQDPPPKVLVTKISDLGTVLQVRWWTRTKQTDHLAVTSQAIPAIQCKLAEHDIELAYPMQQPLLKERQEEPDNQKNLSNANSQTKKISTAPSHAGAR